jgi:hypothetical protein
MCLQFFNAEILQTIRLRYDKGLNYAEMCADYSASSANHNNVAVHIRRGDVTSASYGRFTHLTSYKTILASIRETTLNARFHIFSEGKESDFSELAHEDTVMHIEEPMFCTFHGLVTAQQLVMAKSSFSTAAALLSKAEQIYCPNPCNFRLKHWTKWNGS